MSIDEIIDNNNNTLTLEKMLEVEVHCHMVDANIKVEATQ